MGMFRIKNTFISETQPMVSEGLWLKLVDGGVALYLIDGGTPKPLKIVDDNSTASTQDDTVQDLIGSVEDTKTANTINGAKAYADDVKDIVTGTAEDTAEDLTLYGLKAYIDSKTQ